jgi:hypothetical protein
MILNGLARYPDTLLLCLEWEPQMEEFGLAGNRQLAQLRMEKAFALAKLGRFKEARQNFDSSIAIMGEFGDEWDTARRAEVLKLLK